MKNMLYPYIDPARIQFLKILFIVLIIFDIFLFAVGIYKRKKSYSKLFFAAGILLLFIILYICSPSSPPVFNM